jgi:hypothetical protein
MLLAERILMYLRNGRISLWTWWTLQHVTTQDLSTYSSAGGCLIVNGTGTDKYYASSHIYRYIRPGARQIQSSSNNSNVKVVAFYHPINDCMSLVLINTGGATNASVSGANVPTTFEKVTSTSSQKLVRSSVPASGPIALPASSITSLVAGKYRGTTPVVYSRPPIDKRVSIPAASVRVFGLDGRMVATYPADETVRRALPGGTYVRVGVDHGGNPTGRFERVGINLR